MPETEQVTDVAALTVQLLSAYLANNSVESGELADLIRTTRAALTEEAEAETPAVAETFSPAVSVRKSLASSEYIVSLIDGKPYKTLKRHLASHGLTPDTYRSRYGLPANYPMVAPDYAAHRRAVAQKVGLGTRKPAAPVEPQDEPVASLDLTSEVESSEAPKDQQPKSAKAPAKKAAGRTGKKASANTGGDEPADAAEATSAKSASAPEDTQTAETATSEPSTQTETRKASARRKSAQAEPAKAEKTKPARKSAAAKQAPEQTETASDAAPATAADKDDAAAPPQEAASPRRRGRIGLFKADAAQAAEASTGHDNAAAEPKPAKSKSRKTPRMARETNKTEQSDA